MRSAHSLVLGLLLLCTVASAALSGCVRRLVPAPSAPVVAAPVDPTSEGAVLVEDSFMGCEGDGHDRRVSWACRGDWFVHGNRRVHAGVIERLRELAHGAPSVGDDLPPVLGITAEAVEEHTNDIMDAATEWHPWLDAYPDGLEDITLERIRAAARERFLDPDTDTAHTLLQVTLPGGPPVVLTSRSELPYAQPWEVRIGDGAPRPVVSIEISRYVQILVEPDSSASATLEGAAYWQTGFWNDRQLWSDVFGAPWTKRYARQMCTEIDGWDEVSAAWRIKDADIGNINSQPLSFQPDLISREDQLVSEVRWWNRFDEDLDPVHDWSVFIDLHAQVTDAAGRLPCLTKWKKAGPKRVISLDAVGDQGHNETSAESYHDPVWRHSELAGTPDYVLLLRIDGKWVASLLLSSESEGAIVLQGHESISPPFTEMFHPSNGAYATLRPDGAVETRQMPPED